MSTEAEDRPRRVTVAPLVPLALAVSAGIVIDRYAAPFGTPGWGAVALAAVAVVVAWGHRRERVWAAALLLAFAALGGGWHHYRWSDLSADDLARGVSEEPRPAWVRGVLSDVSAPRPGDGARDPGSTRALLEVSAVCDGACWRRASGRVQLIVVGNGADLEAGQAVEAAGSLARVARPLNPGEFDYRDYLRAQGVRLRLAVAEPGGVWRVGGGAALPWTRWLGRARAWSHARLTAGLDPRVAPLAAALLLGRREGVDPDVNDAFARTGTTHLLAISGLHLQVLAGLLWLTFRAVGVERRVAFGAVALATIGYALLVGLMPSVVRSMAMTVTVCLAGMWHRPHRPANLLAMAALVTVALNPAHLFDVGGQLSFLAIAAIVWGVRPANDLIRFGYHALTFRYQGPGGPLDELERRLEPWWRSMTRRWQGIVFGPVTVSLVVWLAALPLVALRFHLVSPIGVLLNIPLVPLTSAALLASGLALGLSAVWAPLGAPAAWLCSLLLGWTEAIVRWGAAQRWGHAFVPGPPWAWVAAFYGLLGLATAAGVCRWPVRRWAWGTLCVWTVLGLGLCLAPRRPGALEADVLAVGHGLAVVVQSADGRTALYDCGRMGDPSVGRRVVAPALWARGVSRLDAVILSHADSDHYNGLPDLLDRFRVGVVRVPPGFAGPANPGAGRLVEQVRARRIAVRTIAAGERWGWAGTRFSVLHPPAGWPPDTTDNARSVVLEVESRGRRILLTGDLEREGLAALVDQPAPPLDIFLAPHHGGRTANPDWLYRWADPSLVVVSQRPPAPGSKDALAALADRGTPLLRTWNRGAVRLRWTERGIAARGFLEGTRMEGTESHAEGAAREPRPELRPAR
jgi:competence protein ComEC